VNKNVNEVYVPAITWKIRDVKIEPPSQ